MKKILLLVLFLISSLGYSQKKHSLKLGKTTKAELELTVYDKDSTANALVLQEHANLYIDEGNDYKIRTDYYKRIKFFNKTEEAKATVTIKLYKEEELKGIKGITYNIENGEIKEVTLSKKQIFTKKLSDNWKEVTFTLPQITDGCVIEYSYSLINFTSDIKDWYFQSDIPKLKSDHRASIPGNWRYNAKVFGYQEFDRNEAYVKKNCLFVPGIHKKGACVVTEYGMDNIPAFKEERYMLSKKNFISRLSFELISFTNVDGSIKKYTKTWSDADKTIRNFFFDKQTNQKKYFKNKLPEAFLGIKDPLEKAKAIYYHIQERMYWNGNYWTSKALKLKKSYEEKKGSVDAINLTLYNSLQAYNIESYMVMLSTRNNGMPAKLFPAVDDFNYAIVKVIVKGETFFLDATNKFLPFGEVPKRCLNGEARVLDFEKVGYWETIKPRFKTALRTHAQLELKKDELTGTLIVDKRGYFSVEEKINKKNKSEDDFLDEFETEHSNIEVIDAKFEGVNDNEKAFKAIYDVKVDYNENGNQIEINPFVYIQNKENPFKLKERNYPVDFGYANGTTSVTNIKIPEGYIIKSLPEARNISIATKGTRYLLKVHKTKEGVGVFVKLDINRSIFLKEEYLQLKEFYNQIIKSQESLIILEKE